jgi:hypothetical protein
VKSAGSTLAIDAAIRGVAAAGLGYVGDGAGLAGVCAETRAAADATTAATRILLPLRIGTL